MSSSSRLGVMRWDGERGRCAGGGALLLSRSDGLRGVLRECRHCTTPCWSGWGLCRRAFLSRITTGDNDGSLPSLSREHAELTRLERTTELRSLDYTTTRRLFTTTLHFQGGSLPPSNATVPNAAPLSGTYYPALKGRTRFPFSFPLPPTSASSSTLGNNAVGRYVLRGFATTLSGGVVDHKSENREVRVVERWVDWREGRWGEGGERKGSEKLRMGGEGRLEVEARVGMERDGVKGRLFWRRERGEGLEGNGRIEVKVRVRNGSKKNVSFVERLGADRH